jgi:hypothetical protein
MLPPGDLIGEVVDNSVESEFIDPAVCNAAPDGFVPEGGEIIDSDSDGLLDDFVMYAWDPVAHDSTGPDGLDCGVSPDGFVPDGGEIIDSDGDGLPDDFVMHAWDPVAHDSTGLDGLDCGVAPDGFVPEGGEMIDSDGVGLPDDFVMYAWDPVALDSTGPDGLDCGVAPDGFVPEGGEMIDSDGDGRPDDFVMYPYDPIALEVTGHDGLDCGVAPDGFVPEGGAMIDSDGDGLPDDFVMYPYDPIALEVTGHDGLDCGVAPDGFVPEGGEMIDSDGDGLPDDFVMYPYDPIALEVTGHDGLDCGVAPDGFVPEGGDMIDSDGDGLPDDFVMYPYDPISLETPVEVDPDDKLDIEPAVEYIQIRYLFGPQFRGAVANDVTSVGEETPIDIEFSFNESDFESAVDSVSVNPAMLEVPGANGEVPLEAMFYSMSSVGGEELQRTLASADMSDSGNFVLATGASSLFQAEQFSSSLGTMFDSEEDSPAETVIPLSLPVSAVRSELENAFDSDVATNGNQSEGLDPLAENLGPQLETGDNTVPEVLSESPAAETGAENGATDEAANDADEQPAAPAQVSSTRGPINSSSPELAQAVRRAVRVNRAIAEFAIDDFMSEFAQDSFLS